MIGQRLDARGNAPRGLLVCVRRFAFAVVLAGGAVLSLPALTGAASAATGPCPAVGQATGCGVIITINSTAPFVTIAEPGNGNPYDGEDDTLVGIVNNSGVSLSSLGLSSSEDIFGFDGDGICTFRSFRSSVGSYCDSSAHFPTHPDTLGPDYEGPDNTFSGIARDKRSGTVDFTTALGGASSTYFSLESDLVGCTASTDTGNSYVAHRADTPCVTIPNGSVTVTKVDQNGNSLDGGTYSVFTDAAPHSGAAIATCSITTGGSCSTSPSLAPGEYYVYETTPPTGYSRPTADQTVLVIGNDAPVTFKDDPLPVALTITKTGTNSAALDGAGFTLETGGSSPVPVGGSVASDNPCTTSGTPATCTINVLLPGSYLLVETTVPKGYTAAGNTAVTIDSTKSTTVYVTISDTATVAPPTAPLQSTPTATPLAVAPATSVGGATTVHTGEPFAGSKLAVLAMVGTGLGLLGLGRLSRRVARARHLRRS